jgi:hypothetical protein
MRQAAMPRSTGCRAFAAVLGEHVAPGDADVGAAMLNVSGSVARSDYDQAQVAALVPMTSLREARVLLGRIPARASSGAVSSKIRPFDKRNADARHVPYPDAQVQTLRGAHSTATLADALDARAERAQLLLEARSRDRRW